MDSSYSKLPQGLTQTSQGGYALRLAGYKGPSGRHKVELASVNVDGSSSTLWYWKRCWSSLGASNSQCLGGAKAQFGGSSCATPVL